MNRFAEPVAVSGKSDVPCLQAFSFTISEAQPQISIGIEIGGCALTRFFPVHLLVPHVYFPK
jgi:hypothetical protein